MKISKYLFPVLFLLAFVNGFSQQIYRVTLSANDNMHLNPHLTRPELRSISFIVYFSDGSERELLNHWGNPYYRYDIGREKKVISEFEYDNSIHQITNIISYYTRSTNNFRGSTGSPGFTPCGGYAGTYQGGVNYSVDAFAVLNISRSGNQNDLAGYLDPIEIEATSGFPEEHYGAWQYQIGINGEWTDIPRGINLSSSANILKVIPKDFLPREVINNPEKSVNFRIKTCEYYFPSENVLNYRITNSAPHILGIVTENVSCYDSSDGKVTVEFDRALKPGETMDIAIADLTKPNNDGLSYDTVKNENGVVLDEENKITVGGLPAGEGEYAIQMVVGQGGDIYYSDGISHSEPFKITRPDNPVDFEIDTVVNNWCNDGDPNTNDGEIWLRAYGGRDGEFEYKIYESDAVKDWEAEDGWIAFEANDRHAIKERKPNVEYQVKVRKKLENGVYCYAKNQEVLDDGSIALGAEKILTAILTQPERSLQVEYLKDGSKEPLAYGYSDGVIKAKIWGGIPKENGQYTVEWKNSSGDVLTISNVEIVDQVDEQGKTYKANYLTLEGIPSDYYYLTVYDNNYEFATERMGCYVESSEYFLDEPEKLIVEIKETKNISCNSENIYSDPYSNGELTAEGQGGVQLNFMDNGGLLYYYTWNKKDENGHWQELSEQGPILTDASAGEYRVIITDANEIETEYFYTLQQPDLLEIKYSKTDLDCDYKNKGSISISVTGGVPGYDIQWSNGETTPQIQDLAAGTYMVYVTDSRGCQAVEEIKIEQPEGIAIQVLEQRAPTCFEGNDGALHVEVTGGTAPYTYLWNTGDTNPFVTDLAEGTYELKITDAKGCMAHTKYTLDDPAPLAVDLGEDRTICMEQGIIYDITINDPGAIYKWESDNGFSSTSPIVELTEGGNYKATVITSQGCEGTDELTVNVSDKEIDAYFLLTTQAFAREEVVLVNVSEFLGESVEWTVPEGVEKVFSDKEGLIVYFEEPGSYDINLRSYQGNCYQDYTKKIIVEEAADLSYAVSDPGFINEFIVYPNPTDGEFKVKVSLAEAADISIKIISLTTSSVMHSRTGKSTNEYLLDYNLDLVPGMYIMLLETPHGKEIRKMIFN